MIEDKSLNAFIKAKLEEDIVIPRAFHFPQPLKLLKPLRLSYLLAASVLAVCGIMSVHFGVAPDHSAERDTVRVIEMLDDSMATSASDVFSERLLAWQDAPYTEILDSALFLPSHFNDLRHGVGNRQGLN